MSYLTLLLISKITVTTLLVALPFLLAPLAKLEATTRLSADSTLFFRLYGIAITALLVGYGFGIPAAENGHFPWGVVSMGLVSNAGAAGLLLRTSKPSSSGFWLGIFFALVAVALIREPVLKNPFFCAELITACELCTFFKPLHIKICNMEH